MSRPGPLVGIRILDLTRLLPGPVAFGARSRAWRMNSRTVVLPLPRPPMTQHRPSTKEMSSLSRKPP